MPGYRCLCETTTGKRWYFVNQPSAAPPDGYGQEETIRAIWKGDTNSAPGKR